MLCYDTTIPTVHVYLLTPSLHMITYIPFRTTVRAFLVPQQTTRVVSHSFTFLKPPYKASDAAN